MKVAVLLPGQIRNSKECTQSIIKNIVEPYSADVFIHTWNPIDKIKDHRGKYIPNDASIEELKEQYKPRDIVVEDFDTVSAGVQFAPIKLYKPYPVVSYDGCHAWESKIENLFYMWYKTKKVFDIMEATGEKYDLVIKIRFDLEFIDFPKLNPKENTVYIPINGDHRGGINDIMAAGDQHTMRWYCNLFDYLNAYAINPYRPSKGYVCLHPESTLKYHLEQGGFSLERFALQYKLRGELL